MVMKKNLVLHPFLFAVSPVLILLSNNIHELLSIIELLIVLLVVSAAAGIALSILKIIVKEWHIAAFIASLGIFLFFSYGYFCRLIWNFSFTLFGWVIGRNEITFFIWFCLFSAGTLLLLKKRPKAQQATYLVNIYGLMLVIVPLITIIFNSLTNRTVSENQQDLPSLPSISVRVRPEESGRKT